MKNTILFTTLFFAIFCVKFTVATGVDQKTAEGVAETFTSARNEVLRIKAIRQCKPLGEVSQYTISNTTRLINDQTKDVLAYIMHLEPNGFIAISSDDTVKPIVAYSFSSNFIIDDDPANILYHMLKMDMCYRRRALPLIDEKTKNQNKDSWNKYLANPASVLESQLTTQQWPDGDDDGWLDTTWQQSSIYNDSCPPDPTTANQCLTGCVATAMAQIVNYWEFPNAISFNDGDNYRSVIDPDGSGPEPQRRIWIDVDPDGLNDGQEADEYEYDPSMSSINYNESGTHPSNQTIADIMFACGVSVEMGYSDIASGAYTSEVATALTFKFGYDSAGVMDPDHYPNFYDVLENNMKNGEPGQLAIERGDGSGDHSIVCDGYRDDGTYHLNFGWGSSNPDNISQAWYSLPTGMPSGYSVVKYGIVNIKTIASENNDPFLLNAWVYPPSGTITTDFEYTVDYHDVDGDPPEGVWVWIDSVSYGMDFVPDSGTPASGGYNYVTELSIGTHNYSFSTTDVRGGHREIGPYMGPSVDVSPPGTFTIVGYTIDDSPSIEPQNNGDGIFQSGEKVKIRPQLYYDGPIIAINIYASLIYDGSDLVIPNGDFVIEYPYINTGESAYPLGDDHFPILADQDFTGTESIDVQIVWEVEDEAYSQLIVGGLALDIQPAAYISVVPREWDFGVSGTDVDITKLVTIYNNGTEEMHVTDINITPSQGDTTWTGGSFPWTISVGGSKITEVTIGTSELQGLIERTITMISDARLSYYTHLSDRIVITGLVSDTPPAYKVPGTISDSTWPDVSGNLIVWQESGDIYGYDLVKKIDIDVCTDSNHQGSPKISGNIVAWDDMRSGTHQDVYGYDLGTDEEFPVSTESINEELLGVDGNIVAFVRWDFTWPSYTDEISGSNLYYYDKATDVTTQVTYYNASGTGSPLIRASANGDFTDSIITWQGKKHEWIGGGNGWSSAYQSLIMKFKVGVDSTPVLIDEKGTSSYGVMSDTPTTSNGRIAWIRDHRSSSPYYEHVWTWNNGVYTQVTTENTDHDDSVIGSDFIVYEKDSASGLFYWDLIGNSEALVTDMGYINYWQTDKHMVVWKGGISSADGIYYTSINQADIAVTSPDISFSDDQPLEGSTIDVNVTVHNLNPWDTTENITVQLYDGDPNDPNTQLGSDEVVLGGIVAQGSAIVEFNDIPVGVEGSHNIYACIDVPGGDNPANNKACKTLMVGDIHPQGPIISNVVVQEFNGDGDGRIEDDEQIMISWQATHTCGINSSWCTIDANDYAASGTYYVIVGPYAVGNYDFTISATDGDISPETTQYSSSFIVSFHGDITEDGKVDYEDLLILTDQWLQPPGTPSADIAPSPVDGVVNFLDFAVLAENWQEAIP